MDGRCASGMQTPDRQGVSAQGWAGEERKGTQPLMEWVAMKFSMLGGRGEREDGGTDALRAAAAYVEEERRRGGGAAGNEGESVQDCVRRLLQGEVGVMLAASVSVWASGAAHELVIERTAHLLEDRVFSRGRGW